MTERRAQPVGRSFLSAAKGQRFRRPLQAAALLAFLSFLVLATQPGGGDMARLIFRFDPLTSLSGSLASRSLLPGWPLALAFLLSALLLGRAWCGWLCPLGTLLDLLPAHRVRPGDQPIPQRWRQVKWLLLVLILGAALLGNLTLLIFDPLTLLTRAVAGVLWPAFGWLTTGVERLLYQVPALQPAVLSLDGWLRGTVLRAEPAVQALNWLLVVLLLGVLLLNAVRRRFWCRYLCPLGGLLGMVSRASWLRRQVDEAHCLNCQRCNRSCPMGTIDPKRHYASDPAECILCLECAQSCQLAGVRFGGAQPWGVAPSMDYDPSRRAVLAALAASVAGVGVLRIGPTARQPAAHWLQPPGAAGNGLLDTCIRCGACLQVCPTGGLQPSLGQAGLEGLWTPVLVPRLGYCDYACNACGQVCPTGAIPLLPLAEKQRAVIGQASIDRSRCLPWAGHQPCIVCEEMCPAPDKAIWLEEAMLPTRDGGAQRLQLPHVDRARCIGCGLCEYHCPLPGPAAIRVWAPTTLA